MLKWWGDDVAEVMAGVRSIEFLQSTSCDGADSLPWIMSPLEGLQGREFKAFHVRHEASLVELFFDLFFIANLTTFIAVHEITNGATARASVGS